MRPPVRRDGVRDCAALVDQARRLALRYGDDDGHGERVLGHARRLLAASIDAFAQPGRAEAYGLRLDLAALLHDIGRFIALPAHNRHSRYLIRHSDATRAWPEGLRDEVALLSGAHRGPVRAGALRRRLGGDRDLLRLAALLRIADGLDRGHAAGVSILAFERAGDGWRLVAGGLGDKDLKRLETRKADLFARAFGAALSVLVPLVVLDPAVAGHGPGSARRLADDAPATSLQNFVP